jgi:maleamate amidohydrolase
MGHRALEDNYRGVFDGRIGFGRRPAMVAVDLIQAYTRADSPLYAPAVLEAARQSGKLAAAVRQAGFPVFHTRVEYSPSLIEGGLFVRKIPVLQQLVSGSPLIDFVPEAEPVSPDVVILKQYASAFFGTSLASSLTAAGVDTLIVTGCSTSGCVRATAVDGMQHGFRVVVAREAVADRAPEPHEANLFDMNSKYADVLAIDEIRAYIDGLARS